MPEVLSHSANYDTDKGGSVAVGDTITYELSATIPSNIKDYKTYKLEFKDTLSEGLTYSANSVKKAKLVKADGSSTNLENPSVAEGDSAQTHVFTYDDIMKLLPANYSYTKGDKIVFQYDATVNQNAQTGKDLSNKVELTYSNDPNSNGEGTSKDTPKVHEYTYQLVLNKVDLGTEKALDGATFTIKNAAGEFIDANGGKSNTAVSLSATNGVLNVKGLDAGTYTVDETSVPSPYDTAAEFTFTIEPTFNDDGTINTLGNTVNRQGDVIAGTVTGDTGDNVLTAAEGSGSDVTTGKVTVTVGDKKEITMPLTGMKGTTALMVYGSAILVISAAAYLKHKRNANSDDAE